MTIQTQTQSTQALQQLIQQAKQIYQTFLSDDSVRQATLKNFWESDSDFYKNNIQTLANFSKAIETYNTDPNNEPKIADFSPFIDFSNLWADNFAEVLEIGEYEQIDTLLENHTGQDFDELDQHDLIHNLTYNEQFYLEVLEILKAHNTRTLADLSELLAFWIGVAEVLVLEQEQE